MAADDGRHATPQAQVFLQTSHAAMMPAKTAILLGFLKISAGSL
jgi:hypothetical protein